MKQEAARGLTKIPKEPQKRKGARDLAKALRLSEADKQAALLAAIKAYERARARYNRKAAQ